MQKSAKGGKGWEQKIGGSRGKTAKLSRQNNKSAKQQNCQGKTANRQNRKMCKTGKAVAQSVQKQSSYLNSLILTQIRKLPQSHI